MRTGTKVVWHNNLWEETEEQKRFTAAVAAMQGMLARGVEAWADHEIEAGYSNSLEGVSVMLADKLLAELAKSSKPGGGEL